MIKLRNFGLVAIASALCLQLNAGLAPAIAQQSANPPTPPPTPPDNRTKPGGSLSGSDSACPATELPLTALVPQQNPVVTASPNLEVLFYVPYGSDTVREGEFSLVSQDEKTRIAKIPVTLPPTPGIIGIEVPADLAEGEYYHWYFKLYCQEDRNPGNNLIVNGWVQRVPLTSERERQIAEFSPEVWYDAIANLRDRLQQSPEDTSLQNHWQDLLRSIQAEALIAEPFVEAE